MEADTAFAGWRRILEGLGRSRQRSTMDVLPHSRRRPTPPKERNVKEILVVDDDELIRELVAEWLTGVGYRTRTASNAETALQLLRERETALIVTDLHMPKLGGAEMVMRLRDEHPDVPLIAMSGHFRSGRHITPEVTLGLGARRALAKPFTRQDLLRAVGEVLGPPTS